MTVNMPVEVFNAKCVNCPDLEVDTITHTNTIVEKVDDDGTIHSRNTCTNALRCIHVQNCKLRYEAVFEEEKEEPKKKTAEKTTPVKKAPARKSTAKKTTIAKAKASK